VSYFVHLIIFNLHFFSKHLMHQSFHLTLQYISTVDINLGTILYILRSVQLHSNHLVWWISIVVLLWPEASNISYNWAYIPSLYCISSCPKLIDKNSQLSVTGVGVGYYLIMSLRILQYILKWSVVPRSLRFIKISMQILIGDIGRFQIQSVYQYQLGPMQALFDDILQCL